jgi:hypothetical protein
MAGLAILGMGFYAIAARGEAIGSIAISPERYFAIMSFFSLLATISLLGLGKLAKRKRQGIYPAFASLIISLLAPAANQAPEMFTFTYWLAIPNGVVGILLLKSIKTLES